MHKQKKLEPPQQCLKIYNSPQRNPNYLWVLIIFVFNIVLHFNSYTGRY